MERKKRFVYVLSFIIFTLIFLTNATYFSYYFDEISKLFSIISGILTIFLVLLVNRLYKCFLYFLFAFGYLSIIFIISSFSGISETFMIRCIYWMLLLILIPVLYSAKIDFKNLMYAISKFFLIWIIVNHIIDITFIERLPITNISDELMYDWFPIKQYCFVFFHNFSDFTIKGLKIYRACAPFGEPGIAQMYLNYGLIYTLFYLNDKRRRNIFIFSLGIVLCLSLIGIVIMLTIYIIYFVYKKRFISLFICMFLLIIPLIIVVIFQKLDTESFVLRINDYKHFFEIIIDNFPFGIGVDNGYKYDTGFYCGLLYPFLEVGIFFFLYYILFLNIYFKFSNKKIFSLSIMLMLVLSLLTEPQANGVFVFSFIFYSLYNRVIESK